jgi:hypothetical protein
MCFSLAVATSCRNKQGTRNPFRAKLKQICFAFVPMLQLDKSRSRVVPIPFATALPTNSDLHLQMQLD